MTWENKVWARGNSCKMGDTSYLMWHLYPISSLVIALMTSVRWLLGLDTNKVLQMIQISKRNRSRKSPRFLLLSLQYYNWSTEKKLDHIKAIKYFPCTFKPKDYLSGVCTKSKSSVIIVSHTTVWSHLASCESGLCPAVIKIFQQKGVVLWISILLHHFQGQWLVGYLCWDAHCCVFWWRCYKKWDCYTFFGGVNRGSDACNFLCFSS